jgi:signal transduction histidine kinase
VAWRLKPQAPSAKPACAGYLSPRSGLRSVPAARFSAPACGDELCVSVADEGLGIPAEALPHLFERFYRAPNVAVGPISGMGLGLYLVHEIITRHGGSIVVESVEGQGSTFTVCLPAG